MTMHQERISSCLKLIRIVNHYIMGLRLRLGILKKEAVKVAVTSESEEEEEEEPVEKNLSWDLRIFVDNLPFNIDIDEVVGLLLIAGNVQMVRSFIDNQTLRSSGFAFVTMSSVVEAQDAAQKLNGLIIGGRTIRVTCGPPLVDERSQFRRVGGSDSSKRLYVGNLSWNVNHQALGNLFREHGKVLEARVVYDWETGRSRGFGFVTYRSTEDMENALSSLNGTDLYGRRIRVSVAKERKTRALLSWAGFHTLHFLYI
ncbi:hypothetical protein MKX03_016832 [Papaver bracteatum]|nr:hypothetical protein MKX03_016832 [Papaver bracteatum]